MQKVLQSLQIAANLLEELKSLEQSDVTRVMQHCNQYSQVLQVATVDSFCRNNLVCT